MPKLDSFTTAYIEAALWSTNDESDETGGKPLDENYSISDIAPASLEIMIADCAKFQAAHSEVFGECVHSAEYSDAEQAGHDFWLTRNRHGAGFWETPDWSKEAGQRLTAAAHAFGEVNLYIGDDGQIHQS